jgi:hypothetical protein
MCDDSLHRTPDAVHRLRPGVIVVGGPPPIADVERILDASRGGRRPLIMGYSSEDSVVDRVLWDRWFERSTDVSVIVDAVAEALEKPDR